MYQNLLFLIYMKLNIFLYELYYDAQIHEHQIYGINVGIAKVSPH